MTLSDRALKIRYNKAMKETDLKKRLSMLETASLALCWHGGTFNKIMDEIHRLRDAGVTTRLHDMLKAGIEMR